MGQAAKATGKAKVTLARAVKSAKISAARRPDGSYAIDPNELSRVYPLTGEPASDMERFVPINGPVSAPAAAPGELAALHQRIAELQELAAEGVVPADFRLRASRRRPGRPWRPR